MKRIALLVGSDMGGERLACINNDLLMFEKHLRSPNGGAYENDEIFKLYNPLPIQVKLAIQRIKLGKPDFLFFYWTGHGGLNNDGITEMQLDDDTAYPISELQGVAKKQMLVLDTCRKFVDEEIPQEKIAAILESATESFEDKRALCRHLYNQRIETISHPEEIYFSCSKGEYSYATRNISKFTDCVFKTCARLLSSLNAPYISMHEVVDEAVPCCQKRYDGIGAQSPDYLIPKARKFFPFAVRP